MTETAAGNAIVAAGLTVGTVTDQSSDTVSAGLVISQSPQAGSSVSSGSSVNLTVSTGPASGGVVDLATHNFTSSATLPAGTYRATENVNVTGGTLTLSPGVTILFQQGTRMNVDAAGRLSALGTEAAPIVLTGEESIRGYWGGLRFYNSNSMTNQLSYVTIEYGGSYWDANLTLRGTSTDPVRVGVENCTLRHSVSYGLSMDDDSILTAFEANTLTGNALGAAYATPETAGYLDDASTYVGNDAGMDVVALDWGSVKTAATWPGIDGIYRASGTITVEAALTLDPGVYIEFENGIRMTVDSAGSLYAVGTQENPIVLTGEEEVRGYWGGLRMYQTNAPVNRLEHVIIEYGGGYWDGNLELRGQSGIDCQVAIVNCVFQDSANYGLSCDMHTAITEFSNNVLTANPQGAAYMEPEAVGYLDETSTYTNNDYDVVEVPGGTVYTAATWPGIDGAYLVTGTLYVDAALAINPGAYVMFASGQRMSVSSTGSLNAVGTAAEGIVFSGEQEVAGYWGGIRLYSTNSPLNQFNYCTIEYGGAYWEANLYLVGTSTDPTQATVTNCHISDSSHWGIELSEYVSTNADIATANTFANNTLGNVGTP